jgi:hypothetical protein
MGCVISLAEMTSAEGFPAVPFFDHRRPCRYLGYVSLQQAPYRRFPVLSLLAIFLIELIPWRIWS